LTPNPRLHASRPLVLKSGEGRKHINEGVSRGGFLRVDLHTPWPLHLATSKDRPQRIDASLPLLSLLASALFVPGWPHSFSGQYHCRLPPPFYQGCHPPSSPPQPPSPPPHCLVVLLSSYVMIAATTVALPQAPPPPPQLLPQAPPLLSFSSPLMA
jgi:hypothetical protein